MSDNSIKKLFVKEKPFQILQQLDNSRTSYATKLHYDLEISKQVVGKHLRKMREYGLVEIVDRSNGRKIYETTERGEELAHEFERLDRMFDEVEQK